MKSTFVEYVVEDLLGEVKGVRARAMFGGYGLYKDDIFFAIIVDDELYYKVGASTQKEYERRGSTPFQYLRKDKKAVSMSYWKLPADVMDDRQELLEWTDKAVKMARAKKSAKINPK